jgi:hypothetical protein
MSTELATPPAASTPPPAAPAKADTPPIPAAQAASVPPPAPAPASSRTKDAPDAPPTIDGDLRKLAADMLTQKAAAKPADAPPAEAAAKSKEVSAEPAKAKETAPVAATEKEPLDIAEPKGMTGDELANWRTLKDRYKKEINDAKNEKATLAAKLKTYEAATPADTEKSARLEAQLKDVQDRLAVHDLRSHPDFVKQYIEPKKNALKEASEIVAYNGKEGVNLSAVLDKPLKDFNAEVSKITEGMNGMDATSVQTALRQAYKLANEEKGALSKAGELKAQLEAKAAAAARTAFEQTRNEIKAKVPILTVPEGASEEIVTEFSEYNQAVSAAMAEAENNSFGRMTEADVARVSHEAAMLKPMSKLFTAMDKRMKAAMELNQQLAAELAGIKKSKAAPSFTGAKEAAKIDASKMDFHQLAKQMLER